MRRASSIHSRSIAEEIDFLFHRDITIRIYFIDLVEILAASFGFVSAYIAIAFVTAVNETTNLRHCGLRSLNNQPQKPPPRLLPAEQAINSSSLRLSFA